MTRATLADGPPVTGSTVVVEPGRHESLEHPPPVIDADAAGLRLRPPVAFIVAGVAQVLVLVAAMVASSAVQLVIVADIVIGAVVFGLLAAADRRRLIAAGVAEAPPWEWATAFPPAYLVLRAGALREADARSRAAVLLQGVAAVAFLVLASVALANGQPFVSVEGTSRPVIGTDIARTVETSWADAGTAGSVGCDNPIAQQEGTEVACRGTYRGEPIAFVARLGAPAGTATPVSIVRWSSR